MTSLRPKKGLKKKNKEWKVKAWETRKAVAALIACCWLAAVIVGQGGQVGRGDSWAWGNSWAGEQGQ